MVNLAYWQNLCFKADWPFFSYLLYNDLGKKMSISIKNKLRTDGRRSPVWDMISSTLGRAKPYSKIFLLWNQEPNEYVALVMQSLLQHQRQYCTINVIGNNTNGQHTRMWYLNIASASSECLDKPALPHSLARVFSSLLHKVWK